MDVRLRGGGEGRGGGGGGGGEVIQDRPSLILSLQSGHEGSRGVKPRGSSASPKSKDFTLRQKLGPFPGDLGMGFAL